MAPLRHLLAPARPGRQRVMVEDRHLFKAVGEHSGGAEPAMLAPTTIADVPRADGRYRS